MRKRLSCREAVKKAILELGGGPVTAEELFSKVKAMGSWSDDTIWQHLMSLVINLPPAYKHWPNTPERFLFLRDDGKYEIYDPDKHGIYSEGVKIKECSNKEYDAILKRYVLLSEKLKSYIRKLFVTNTINITEVTTEYRDKSGVYVFFNNEQTDYVGSTNNLYRRLRHDLWANLGQSQQPHVFGRKLIKNFHSLRKAKEYLEKLKLKIIKTENPETAKILEQILIYLLKPRYNN
ncbi:MAG: hypothetical protein DRJ47_01670 [Thermoprotei archaeon]|nr:MAG: hypothetical protein DRJ47_01670 [Thermoprotei archaeon]